MKNFSVETGDDGIALVTFDTPGRSMNTLSSSVLDDIDALVERVIDDAATQGVLLCSGKPSGFCAGADLTELNEVLGSLALTPEQCARQVYDLAQNFHRRLRRLETSGKPVAVAIEGHALGGGLELAMCGHYRVAADDARIQIGLAEATIGLMPGGGGTQRLPRLIGYKAAARLILDGESMTPQAAQALGIVDAVVAPGSVIDAARAWLKGKADAVLPWDRKGYRLKDGPATAEGAAFATALNASVARQGHGNYPAQIHILGALFEGLQVPIDAGLRVEARHFAHTLLSSQAQAMVRSLFVSMQELSKGCNRPEGHPRKPLRKVAVLGAGMMGAGIAYSQADAGLATVLIDRDQASADRGKDYSRRLLDKIQARGRISAAKAEETLGLIEATSDYEQIRGVDLVVEAVFEDRELKAQVTRRVEALLDPQSVFGSNTSTLPISDLALASQRPENFIGLHFFSPVDRMRLVEIIMGRKTSAETLAKAVDYVLRIGKIPIVVNDSRGFYTSRCFSTYLGEGFELFSEGVPPALIDNIGRMTGMPRGPLELADDVALDLAVKIGKETQQALGAAYKEKAVDRISAIMVEQHGRCGRKNLKGFYDYREDGMGKQLWSGLRALVEEKQIDSTPERVEEIKSRLLFIQALEAARCFEEGVITSPRDADVGSILGWNFARWSGGAISLIDGIGITTFVDRCSRLAERHGERFRPNALLLEMSRRNETFYGRFAAPGIARSGSSPTVRRRADQ